MNSHVQHYKIITKASVKSIVKPTVKSTAKPSEKGSAIILALFIMVVIMLLGTALVKVLSTSSETIAQEVIGTRALAVANSGMQAQLQKLFPFDSDDLICPSADPISERTYSDFNNVSGLQGCSATVTCEQYATVDSINYYRLTSTGTCGSGSLVSDSYDQSVVISSRTVQVEARNLP